MKILIITDTFLQTNGVVTTTKNLIAGLEELNHEVKVIYPEMFKCFDCPTYPEIKIPYFPFEIPYLIKQFNPDHIHITVEGYIGLIAKLYCDFFKIKYTSAYHTKFPEYIESRIPYTKELVYSYLRWFHKKSSAVLVTTKTMRDELFQKGFKNLKIWTRGVDRTLFKPNRKKRKSKTLIYVGRVSIEKNIEDFLRIPKYKKIVVGSGPEFKTLREKYPEVFFVGALSGERLVEAYNQGDVFVFPSKSDTFGLVMLEANSCGLPIAGYYVPGPIDIVENGKNGYLDNNLEVAVEKCFSIKEVEFPEQYTWDRCVEIFLETIQEINEKEKNTL